jgi:predicted nucleotidyltransferase
MTVHGSQCYGLANELSDLDLKGICIPPKDVENNLFHKFEQAENNSELHEKFDYLKNPKNPKVESTTYSLRKFIILAANVNPNIIELLFVEPSDILVNSPTMEKLLENRDLFLSSKAKYSFSGYAFSQLAKIERHRKWIVRGEIEKPDRAKFGLPEERAPQMNDIFGLIKSEVERWNLSQFPLNEEERDELKSTIWELIYNVSQVDVNEDNWPKVYEAGVIERLAKEYNLKEEVVDVLQRERLYKKELESYQSWLNWKKNRNPARHELEVKCGYDSKHASHLARLLRMGLEILNDRKVIVKRPDREELLSIKNGEWSYEKLIEYAKSMQIKLDESYKTTTLPKSVDYTKINELYHNIYEEYHSV